MTKFAITRSKKVTLPRYLINDDNNIILFTQSSSRLLILPEPFLIYGSFGSRAPVFSYSLHMHCMICKNCFASKYSHNMYNLCITCWEILVFKINPWTINMFVNNTIIFTIQHNVLK